MNSLTLLFIGIIAGSSVVALIASSIITKIKRQHLLDLANQQKMLEKARNEAGEGKIRLATAEAEIRHLKLQNEALTKQLAQQQIQLTTEFENIANRILKQRSIELSDHQSQKLTDVLTPLREKIQSFEKKVEETYHKELRDKLDLTNEVKRLYDLNQRISTEANNLTRALKGDIKKMGNWGEMILKRILEQSGLTNGREYTCEVHTENGEGSTIRPDVVIHLPDDKHLIIDSKLSLIAYERYANAESREEQAIALKEHLDSMRTHIKTLHEKNYASAITLNSPDFVLMFIPVEASFAAAVEADANLFSLAWEKQIVPVSPSTLLATLRTIASIWKQDNQNKNAMEIARQSGALYDKLAGFVADMDKIGKNINLLQESYSGAMNKMSTGNGNLLSRAQKIKELGAKTNKAILTKQGNLLDENEQN